MLGAATFAVAAVLWALVGPGRPPRHSSASDGVLTTAIPLAAFAFGVLVPGPVLVGRPVVDAVTRGLGFSVLAALGASAPPAVLGASLLLLTAGLRSTSGGAIAAGGLGFVLALITSRVRMKPWLASAIAIAVGVAATQASRDPRTSGHAIAALAIAIVLCGGLAGVPTPARRRVWSAAAIGIVAVVGLGGLGGIAALRARANFDAALVSARNALSDAKGGNVAAAERELEDMRAKLLTGRGKLDAWWARPAHSLPIVGLNLRAVDRVARAGIELAKAGSTLASAAQVRSVGVTDGRVPVDALRGLDGPLRDAETSLGAAGSVLASLPSRWLVHPISSHLADLASRVADADRTTGIALEAERLAVQLLGGGSPRRYFLALSSPAELRGSAGVIGNYGELVADSGRLSLGRFGRIEDLTAHAPQQPDGLGFDQEFVAVYRTALTGSLWQSVTLAPDFRTAADAIEKLYPASGGTAVDGVVAIDPAGLAALLRLLGPVSVPLWPAPITADTVSRILEHDQYNVFPVGSVRGAFLSELTSGVLAKFRATKITDLSSVMRALGPAVLGKHLLIASRRPDEESSLVALGIAASISPSLDDSLAVFSTNASANKIDWYLRRTIDYAVTISADNQLQADLTIRLQNTAPASGESPNIIGNELSGSLPSGTNRLILSIFTPWDTADTTLDGKPTEVAKAREEHRNLYSLQVDLLPGETRSVHLRLKGRQRSGPYRLDVLSQPTSSPDRLTVSIVGVRGRPGHWSTQLVRDVSFAP